MVSDSEWALWRKEIFGSPYEVWHDGPSFLGLEFRAADAPDEVARMLAAGLEAHDPVAAQSFAALWPLGTAPKSSIPLLLAVLPAATGTFLVRVAQALRALTGDEAWSARVASVLVSASYSGDRMDAAIALSDFAPTPELVESLGRAVRDPDYFVRYHASTALLRYAGRIEADDVRTVADFPEIFDRIAGPHLGDATSYHETRRREAADLLTEDALRRR